MNKFKGRRKIFINIYPGPAEEMDLPVELQKISSSFVINYCIWNKSYLKAHGVYADTELYVFAKPGQNEPSGSFPYLSRYTHVKTSRMILTSQVFIISSDASRSKWRSHGITDSFLNRCKRGMSCVRTAICIEMVL